MEAIGDAAGGPSGKSTGQNGRAGIRLSQHMLMGGGRSGFIGDHEGRPEACRAGPQIQNGADALTIHNAARRDHRQRRGLHRHAQQGHQPDQ